MVRCCFFLRCVPRYTFHGLLISYQLTHWGVRSLGLFINACSFTTLKCNFCQENRIWGPGDNSRVRHVRARRKPISDWARNTTRRNHYSLQDRWPPQNSVLPGPRSSAVMVFVTAVRWRPSLTCSPLFYSMFRTLMALPAWRPTLSRAMWC